MSQHEANKVKSFAQRFTISEEDDLECSTCAYHAVIMISTPAGISLYCSGCAYRLARNIEAACKS